MDRFYIIGIDGGATTTTGVIFDNYGKIVFDPAANQKELYDFLHILAEENNGVYDGR